MVPLRGQQIGRRVRRVDKRVVIAGPLTRFDLADLAGNRQHRITEPVDLGDRFGLRRLDHQGARHREGHRRRVKAEIDKPFGDVLVADAAALLDVANVDDAFMRHPSVRAGVEHRIMRCQPRRHVVGGKDRRPGRRLQPLASHHADIGIGDWQDTGGPERRGADRAFAGQR